MGSLSAVRRDGGFFVLTLSSWSPDPLLEFVSQSDDTHLLFFLLQSHGDVTHRFDC